MRPVTRSPRSARLAGVLSLLLLSAGCVTGEPDDGGDDTPSPTPSASAEGGRGGPATSGAAEADLRIGGVRTEAVENDTVELSTAAPLEDQEGASAQLEWTPRFRLTFHAAEREGSDVTFRGEARYLHDEGAWVVHSRDFSVLVPKEGPAGQYTDFDDSFHHLTAAKPEVLATLTPQEPARDFSVTIADVPPQEAKSGGDPAKDGHYVEYATPEKLWGHTTKAPRDYVPGRLCYVEGAKWHDTPLFEFTDLPCG